MNGKKNRLEEGITTLILLLLLSVVAIFVVTLISSRVIFSLRRGFSSVDTIVSSYGSETEISDVLARIVGEYENVDNLEDYLREFPDGSVLEVEFKNLPTLQTIIATTRRPYAVSKIKAERTIPVVEVTEAPNVEIVVVLDCTGSMGNKASNESLTSRFYEQREAVKAFIEGMKELPDVDRYTIGVVVYGYTTSWYKDSSHKELKSLSGISDLQRLYDEIHEGFGDPPDTDRDIKRDETRCQNLVEDYTNTGAGLKKAEDYFTEVGPENKKAIVLVTDGIPNSKTKDAACPNNIVCHGSNSACFNDARDYLRCRLADTSSEYLSEVSSQNFFGVRDPLISTYAVTVLEDPKNSDEAEIFNKTVAIFNAFSDTYYNSSDATKLTEILETFLGEITEQSSTITIERVIPGTNLPN